MSIVDRIIKDLEDKGIELMILDNKPRYGDGSSWERADREVVEQTIAQSIANHILQKD